MNVAPQLATVPTALPEARHLQHADIRSRYHDRKSQRNGLRAVAVSEQHHSLRATGIRSPQNCWRSIRCPTLTAATNFLSDQAERISNDQYNIRGDHRFSEKDTFFARYSKTDGTNILPAPLPPPASLASNVTPEAHSVVGSETHIFRGNLINEWRVGYMETRELQQVPGTNLNCGIRHPGSA